MPEPNKNQNNTYSLLDSMSTEALEKILHADSMLLSNGESSDTETMLYIMEVIAQREKEQPTGKFTDVKESWASFCEYYLPYASDDKPLYDFEDNNNKETGIESVSIHNSPRTLRKSRLLRIASISVAIIATVLLAGTVTASSLGYNLWSVITEWTKETFTFAYPTDILSHETPSVQKDVQFSDLQSALDAYGVQEKVVPKYIPDGYEPMEVSADDMADSVHFTAVYRSKDDNFIIISVIQHTGNLVSQYQKNPEDPELYETGGTHHYIIKNMDKYLVIWSSGLLEGCISGLDTRDDLVKMIDSIYKE